MLAYFSGDSCNSSMIGGDNVDQVKQLEHFNKRTIT